MTPLDFASVVLLGLSLTLRVQAAATNIGQDNIILPTNHMRPAFQAKNLKRDTRAISNEWRQEMLVILNNLRAQAGVQTVELRDEINDMAQKHSEYQAHANVMTHKDPSGSLGDRGSASGIKWSRISENVAFGSQTVEDVMKMWVSSPPHYANMLGNYSLVGFGLASNNTISKYDIYWTQNFILPRLI